MNANPPIIATDRECVAAWKRRPGAESLRPLVERYLPFVYSSALRRTGEIARATEVTRAVFLAFTRRARKLRKKTVVADWFFQVSAIACRKLIGKPERRWSGRKLKNEFPPDAPLWLQLAPQIDGALDQLSPAQRQAVLLVAFLNHDQNSAARMLRTRERRVGKRVARGLKKLANRLRKRGVKLDSEALATVCSAEGCAPTVPEGLTLDVLAAIDETQVRRPSLKLARRTLATLAWKRWRRRIAFGIPTVILSVIALGWTAWYLDSLSGHSRSIATFLIWSVKNEGRRVPGLAQPARPWPTNASNSKLNAASVRSARDLYQTTNIWPAHLKFSREQWKALEPKRIGALPHFLQSDGTVLLRHPGAQRSGLAGVLGFDFDWTHADFDFGGVSFTNVAARFKGNGTYLSSLYGVKRSFKVDLNKFMPKQKLGSVDEINFNNLVNDHSCMSDALACEFFREAGVPAPRTAYAWLTLSVTGQWDRRPLGIYVMVEPVDAEFAFENFGSRKTPVFKPVTYKLFEHLGDDWSAYAAIYDLKTKATLAQTRRVIEFARLVSFADDAEFAARLGDFLDLDAFARFIAGEVILSNYDSFLCNGQNFYVYLNPTSNKFGFIPWDMDLSWGSFFLLGTTREREQASIWHPWVGQNRFLERVMATEEFRKIYRAHLEDFLARLFVPTRLNQRIDEMAQIIRSPLTAESDFRLQKFEDSVSERKVERASRGNPQGANRPAHQLKRFVEKRTRSVREQLDGKSDGVILHRSERR